MAIKWQVTSPYKFPERFLFFGEGGSGKTTAVLNMARHMPDAHFWVNETDISQAYERMMALGYPDVYERDQVTVENTTDWAEFVAANERFAKEGDPSRDVLVIDNGTFPWTWAQDAHIQAMYGMDADEFMSKLKKQYKDDDKGYFAALSDGMQWPMINKKFFKGFYRVLHKWHGHAIVVAFAKDIKGERDESMLTQFRIHGCMPAGQKDLPYAMGTNIHFMDRGKGMWAYSTTKDRERDKVFRHELTSFSFDYLVDVAEWERERIR